MKNKIYLKKVMDSADDQKKEEVIDLVCELMEPLKKDEYEEIERKIYEISEGKVLNEEKARYLIKNMKPIGMK